MATDPLKRQVPLLNLQEGHSGSAFTCWGEARGLGLVLGPGGSARAGGGGW